MDGDGLILRLYEPYGRRGRVSFGFRGPIASVDRVNLLEEPVAGPPIEVFSQNSAIGFAINPFEIVTLRIRP